jgi:hypothetical protein
LEPPAPTDGGIGWLVAAVWRRRYLVALGSLLCGIAAGGLSMLRPKTTQAVVQIRMGAIAPIGFVEQGEEIVQRLSSLSSALDLAQMKPADAATAAGVDRKDLRAVLALSATVHGQGRLVQFVVEAPNEELARKVALQASQQLKEEHDAIFDTTHKENLARIQQLEEILERMKKDEAAVARSPEVAPEVGRWTAVAQLAKDISSLKEANLPPKAFRTRIIAGPDVKPSHKGPSRILTVLFGLFTGAVLALILIVAAESAAPYLEAKER